MTLHDLTLIAPELWMASFACFILLFDVFLGRREIGITYALTQVTLLGGLSLLMLNYALPEEILFNQTFVLDKVSTLLKIFIFIFGIGVFLYSRKYVREHESFGGEYYTLSLFSILGMMILVSAKSFLTLYLGVELLTLPLYALIAMSTKDKLAPEAAMKYFVMGALASGMLLFGISLLYGLTGSFEMEVVSQKLAALNSAVSPNTVSPNATPTTLTPLTTFTPLNSLHNLISNTNITLLFGILFVLAGLAFKLGAVPFHLWIPDVYQGAPVSVTLFIATLPELAGFGMAIRILLDTFNALSLQWQPVLILITASSLILGNVAAIAQTNIKRMLGYSTIGHMGFIFLGLLAGPEFGYASAFAYMVIYVLMALGAFGIITALSQKGFEVENIADFQGLSQTQPLMAFLMLLLLFSLAGIPPTIGFYAKFMVLDAAVRAGYISLSVLALITSVIGAFYYLRIVRVMYFEAPNALNPAMPYRVSGTNRVVLSLNGFLILGLGIFPAPLINLCMQALQQ